MENKKNKRRVSRKTVDKKYGLGEDALFVEEGEDLAHQQVDHSNPSSRHISFSSQDHLDQEYEELEAPVVENPAPKTTLQEARDLEKTFKQQSSYVYRESKPAKAAQASLSADRSIGTFERSTGWFKPKEEIKLKTEQNDDILFQEQRDLLEGISVLEQTAQDNLEKAIRDAGKNCQVIGGLNGESHFDLTLAKFHIQDFEKELTLVRQAQALSGQKPYTPEEENKLQAIAAYKEWQSIRKISENMHKRYYALLLMPVIAQLKTEIAELEAVLKKQGTRADNRHIELATAISEAKKLAKELDGMAKGRWPRTINVRNPNEVIAYMQNRITYETANIFNFQYRFNIIHDAHVDGVRESLGAQTAGMTAAFKAEKQRWRPGDFISGARIFNERKTEFAELGRSQSRRWDLDLIDGDLQKRTIAIRNLTDFAMEATKRVFDNPDLADEKPTLMQSLPKSCHPGSKDFDSQRFMDMLTGYGDAQANALRKKIIHQMVMTSAQEGFSEEKFREILAKYDTPGTRSHSIYNREYDNISQKLDLLHAYAHQEGVDPDDWKLRKENEAIAKQYIGHVHKQIKTKSKGATQGLGTYKTYRAAGIDHTNALNIADYDRNINAILATFEQGSWERDFHVEGEHKAAQYDRHILAELEKALKKRSAMLAAAKIPLDEQPSFFCTAGSFATCELRGKSIKMKELSSLVTDYSKHYQPTARQSIARGFKRAVLNLFDTLNALKIWVYRSRSGLDCNQLGRVMGHVQNYQLSRLPEITKAEIQALPGGQKEHQQRLVQIPTTLLDGNLHPKIQRQAPRR